MELLEYFSGSPVQGGCFSISDWCGKLICVNCSERSECPTRSLQCVRCGLSSNVWMFGCMDVWMFGCLNVWMFECLDVWIFGCLDVWMFECLDVWMFGFLDVWVFECLDVWMFECLDVWMFGCLDVWMFGCLNFWMYGWRISLKMFQFYRCCNKVRCELPIVGLYIIS